MTPKPFLKIVLESLSEETPAGLAHRLAWSPQRVSYLLSDKCRGFPLSELWHLKRVLGLTTRELLELVGVYLEQKTG
jgi:hypothetical protein